MNITQNLIAVGRKSSGDDGIKKGSSSAVGLLNKLPFWRVLRLDGVF